MSGGSYDYLYGKIEEYLVGRMFDPELDALAKDFAQLCYDLEWWQSGDTSEKQYRKTVDEFKRKWLRGEDIKRLKGIIDEQLEEKRNELYQMIGIPQKKTEKS